MKLEVTIWKKEKKSNNKDYDDYGTKTVEFLVSKCDLKRQPPGPTPN